MAVVRQNWFALNSARRYPFHDGATGEPDDGGTSLPDDLVVDLTLRFPSTLGLYAYLSAAQVSRGIVTLLFAAADTFSSRGDYRPLASISVPRPARLGTAYPLTPLADGVAGWIVLGQGVETLYRGLFSGPSQTLVAPRCARAYRPPAVLSLGKEGVSPALSGVVRLRAGADVEVVAADRVISGRVRRCVVVRLKQVPERNVFQYYIGPCGGRPESQNCDGTPVESINDVKPDCDGNIQISFFGVKPSEAENGIVLDYNLGLSESCDKRLPTASGVLPNERDDACTGPYEGYDPTEANFVGSSSSSEFIGGYQPAAVDTVGEELPYYGGFGDSLAAMLSPESGEFRVSEDGWLATGEGRAASVWAGGGLTAEARFRFDGPDRPGKAGVILGWHLAVPALREQYLLAAIDRQTRRVELLFFNGESFATIASAGPLPAGDLSVRASVFDAGRGVWRVVATAVAGGVEASAAATTSRVPAGGGKPGVGSVGPASFQFLSLSGDP